MTKTETKPQLDTGSPTDERKRHIVERIGGPESKKFSRTALCGYKASELLLEHSGDICQKCVDIQKQRPRR